MVHRVKIGGNERWVGFIGGGQQSLQLQRNGLRSKRQRVFRRRSPDRGRLRPWGFTRANDVRMDYAIPGTAAIVDSDNDGFTNLAYIGDMGGNVWRLSFCTPGGPVLMRDRVVDGLFDV